MINNNQTLKPGPNKSRLNCEHNLSQDTVEGPLNI